MAHDKADAVAESESLNEKQQAVPETAAADNPDGPDLAPAAKKEAHHTETEKGRSSGGDSGSRPASHSETLSAHSSSPDHAEHEVDDNNDNNDDGDDNDGGPRLAPIATAASRASHVSSMGADMPAQPWSSFVEIPDSFYDRLTPRRKQALVLLMSFCAFLSPISSTTVLSAVSEVAAEFGTTETVVAVSNALYMLFMGMSPLLWGPMSEVYGRRWIMLLTLVLFLGCSIGTALAPNIAAFFIFRILTAYEGTAFILVGSASISDIYRPTERGRAMGWFLSGMLFGPAFGPFIGGIIVTYRSWRVIFWLQTALGGAALVGAATLLPETIHHKKQDLLVGLRPWQKARVLGTMISPMRVIRLYVYPNVVTAGLASSALVWNQYSLLTPITYVLNPRFGLTTPLQAGLFYLAPGFGYVTGTFVGGRYADYMVRKWIRKRGGVRVPEDRLRSALPFIGIAIPGCMLVYGWAVEKSVGGIPLVVISMFLQGVAQLFCFPSLNTYCLDVMPEHGSEVIAGNYFIRFLFACVGTAVALPAIESIGVGWFSTITAFFLIASAAGLYVTVLWGQEWRERVARWRNERRKAEYERGRARLENV